MRDHEVVEAFVAFRREKGYPALKIDSRPENDKSVPANMRIDAIAKPFAIEHTLILTLQNQKAKDDWFIRAAGGLESELPSPLYRLQILIDYEAITKGQNWAAIREALKNWIIEDCPQLLDGRHTLENLPGIPFRLRVTKASDRRPGIFFARYTPEDNSLPKRLRQQLDQKIKKLTSYKDRGCITILLIESEDLALMNEVVMLNAIKEAYPDGLPPGIDEIWYVDTSIPSALEFRDFTDFIKKGSG